MRIGWLIPTIGAFGAVREMIEISNVLVDRGHDVTIYHPEGGPCAWLPNQARTDTAQAARKATLDVLIGIIDWQPELYEILQQSPAPLKAVCVMGFAPSQAMAAALRGEGAAPDAATRMIRDAYAVGAAILPDGGWQGEWLRKEAGIECGPAFGGVNLRMFHPAPKAKREKLRVIFSGDPRERKGTDTVSEALDLILAKMDGAASAHSYWGRKFTQAQLVEFLQQGDVFLDGHRRAGWCNPVAEAMACGTACVCTDIGAVRDFAIDGETALVVPVDDAQGMAKAALQLLGDGARRAEMVRAGLARIREFDYWRVAPKLESYLEGRLHGSG